MSPELQKAIDDALIAIVPDIVQITGQIIAQTMVRIGQLADHVSLSHQAIQAIVCNAIEEATKKGVTKAVVLPDAAIPLDQPVTE
jgi:hypothetical protein